MRVQVRFLGNGGLYEFSGIPDTAALFGRQVGSVSVGSVFSGFSILDPGRALQTAGQPPPSSSLFSLSSLVHVRSSTGAQMACAHT